jgi:hypothetical protein
MTRFQSVPDGEVGRKLRARLPIEARWRAVFVRRGECCEVDVCWCSARTWRRRPRPGWTAIPIGPFVVALRATW